MMPLKNFEKMRDMAELKALSRISLEWPLSDREFERLIQLKRETLDDDAP